MAGDSSGEPDPVDQPGVDRVADDYLLAWLDGGEQHVQDAVQPASDADALGAGVVTVAGDRAHMRRGRLAERPVPLKGQVTVRVIPVYFGMRDLAGDGRRREVGVKVLQAQEARVAGGVSGITDLVHADSRDVPSPGDGHARSFRR